MTTRADTVRYILDQAGLGDRLTSRKMFGEYALYLDGKVVALVCDDQLHLKPTEAGRGSLGDVTLARPYPGAKPSKEPPAFLAGGFFGRSRSRFCLTRAPTAPLSWRAVHRGDHAGVQDAEIRACRQIAG